MRVIFAKHDGCSKEFAFSVPDGMRVHKGDLLLVSTKFGETIATATSEPIGGQGAVEAAVHFGAYLPLKPVLAACGEPLRTYIRNSALRDARRAITWLAKDLPSYEEEEDVIPF